MTLTRRTLIGSALAVPAVSTPAIVRAQGVTTLPFLFPVAVGGPITKIIDGYARAFEKDNPDIKVQPVYAGSYTDTLTKAQTAVKGGDAPAMAVLLSTDVYTLIDQDIVIPIDQTGDHAAWLRSFYPAFMLNTQIGGHTWGVPFQRSTIVLYYNKAAFQEVGLNPDAPPATWEEQAAAARKLTVKDKRWGLEIPGGPFAYWMFQALVAQAGAKLANADGTAVSFDSAEAARALDYWLNFQKAGSSPAGVTEWGIIPRDFLEQRAAMVWTTTGNLSNIRAGAKFPFGVAMLPADKQRGTPTGGGNFYLFKAASPAQRAASLRFLQWITSPERAAQWGIDTGYVATRSDAWQTPLMQKYVAGFPAAAVARDQLQYAVPELSTHDNQRVTQALNDALDSALTGTAPDKALSGVQATATRLLRSYK